MSERDFRTKRVRRAFREFCRKYLDKLSMLEAELKVLAIRAGGMVAALEDLAEEKRFLKGIYEAAKKFDDECRHPC